MLPTRLQVKAQFLGLLDDPNAAVFTDTVFQIAFQQAYDALFLALLNHQCPAIKAIASYSLAANTTSLTPSTAGIANFGDVDGLEERLDGSTDKYTTVTEADTLTQRDAGDRLLEFVWRLDTFYFVGATTARQLRITYESSGTAPTNDSDVIGADGSLTFLANFAVGMAGARKGYDEIAAAAMQFAVGPRYSQGQIGGELWRLVSAKVREMQHVQIQQRRYSSNSQIIRRRVPYIQAQGGGTSNVNQFSTFAGNITGTIDGSNAQFLLPAPLSAGIVILNGVTLTPNQHYALVSNSITFIAPYIPQVGAEILVEGWL